MKEKWSGKRDSESERPKRANSERVRDYRDEFTKNRLLWLFSLCTKCQMKRRCEQTKWLSKKYTDEDDGEEKTSHKTALFKDFSYVKLWQNCYHKFIFLWHSILAQEFGVCVRASVWKHMVKMCNVCLQNEKKWKEHTTKPCGCDTIKSHEVHEESLDFTHFGNEKKNRRFTWIARHLNALRLQ